MPPGSVHPRPDPAVLVQLLDRLLDDFIHTDFVFLKSGGTWGRNPVSLRDRISGEILYRLWLAKGMPNWPAPASGLMALLLSHPVGHTLADVGTEPEGGGRAGLHGLLGVLEVLFAAVEHEVYAAGATRYVAEWDYAGKARKKTCETMAAAVMERSAGLPEIIGSLRTASMPLVEETIKVLSEEEAVRWEMKSRATDVGNGRPGGAIDEAPGESLRESLPVEVGKGLGLARPCVEILLNKDLPVSTGFRFQVSDVLGRLQDPRTMEGIVQALDAIEHFHTGTRANLIYALGNLREKGCLERLVSVLRGPEFVMVATPGGSRYRQPLHAEKCEAIWAIGRLGEEGYDAVPALIACSKIPDQDVRVHLAWALGEIGSGRWGEDRDVGSEIVRTLKGLLSQHDSAVFEEAAAALKKLGHAGVVERFPLHDLGKIPLLALKPSSTGLYELSETILHLVCVKRPVVMAVTGDSGTGKTYFCETIAEGFGDIGPDEIVYLMRDRLGDRTLDRLVGLKWLRDHVQPRFYEPYPVPEDQDDPDAYFEDLIGSFRTKKLVVLDGWRDQAYFNRVIEVFHRRGFLDILVHFGTTFSTKRLNLEERERSLERVKMHLPLVEEPVIESTSFYREGSVLIYNLDNSIPARLDRPGIREVFNRRKVDRWEDLIRIGRFFRGSRPVAMSETTLGVTPIRLKPTEGAMRMGAPESFEPSQTTLTRQLNDDLETQPHLLQAVTIGQTRVTRIAFYTQGQIACCGEDGSVGVLVGFNDQAFFAHPHGSAVNCIAVAGNDLYSAGSDGTIKVTSFDRNTITELARPASPAVSLAAYRDGRLVSGHRDGSVRIWDPKAGSVTAMEAHAGPAVSVTVDRQGSLYVGGVEGKVLVLGAGGCAGNLVDLPGTSPVVALPYIDGRVVVGLADSDTGKTGVEWGGSDILLIDPASGTCAAVAIDNARCVHSIDVYFDGRLMVCFTSGSEDGPPGCIAVLDPGPDGPTCTILGGHGLEAEDCLTMGPRVISCGSESKNEHTLKIWGTVSYVAAEHAKASLLPKGMPKPPYYRSLF
jgi:hypothetical protein